MVDRLRWYWSLSKSDKLRYIAKTLKDMDYQLIVAGKLPADWVGHPQNYDKFISDVQKFLEETANEKE